MTYLILFMIKNFVSHKLFCIFAIELKTMSYDSI